ncbi:orotidine-5'-phosphate decarboxylase [Acidocella sp.]|uniref:orotidine-5'-phosphate decarboxylase n=1 Tax=Acidocella sp. TaxID=50710 RepID=UPI003D094466
MTGRLIAAIDTPELPRAQALVRALAPHCGMVKLGLEFFLRHGPQGYVAAAQGADVFLDLKLYDIPNTVAGAVRSLLPLAPRLVTIHAGGGAKMVAAAAEAAAQAGAARPKILAVTVLTSFDGAGLAETGVAGGTAQQVLRLARLALAAGADGLVCSAHEISILRDAFGEKPLLVVPGIRPAGAALGDQARVMTPEQAVAAGADYIVVGRPITNAENPAMAARAIAEAIS